MFENKRLILILPERLGDTLFNTPSIRFLKYHFPNCHLRAVCLTALSAAVVKNNPDLDDIIVAPNQAASEKLFNNCDHVIFLSDYEHGFDRYLEWFKAKALILYDMKNDVPLPIQKLQFLSAQTGKAVLPEFEHYFLYPSQADAQTVDTLLQATKLDSNQQVLIGVHLGCARIARRWLWRPAKKRFTHKKVWPLAKFIKTANRLAKKHPNVRFIVTGTKAEAAMVKHFCKKVKTAVNFANKTAVLETAALMKHLKLYFACDTGTSHIAYAMQTDTLVLFGPTNLKLFGPFPRENCFHILQYEPLQDLPVETVLNELEALL